MVQDEEEHKKYQEKLNAKKKKQASYRTLGSTDIGEPTPKNTEGGFNSDEKYHHSKSGVLIGGKKKSGTWKVDRMKQLFNNVKSQHDHLEH